MLKVVGASWHKTRISTYILLGAGFLAIGAFFLAEMERPQPNGNYCATIFWTEKTGFQVEYWKQRNDFENIPKGVARICYKDSIYQNGWSQLELETQRNYPDWVQAFGAGVLEGTLSWSNIYNQWQNTVASPCDRDEDTQNFCTWLRDQLDTNYVEMKRMADDHAKHDHYWHQIRLFYYQLEGLEAGWVRGAKRARSGLEENIPFVDFLLMNSAPDIQDLKVYYENNMMGKNQKTSLGKSFVNSRASMLVKIFQTENSGWKVLLGHSAAGSYSSMLRVQKRYKFRYHFAPDADYKLHHNVPGTDISFTGYPGVLASTDDFYFVKGRKVHTVIAGVAIKNVNAELFEDVDLKNMMPLAARVMAANRLAQNRRTWEKIMSRHLSSGSKQWLQIDLKKLDYLQLHSINNSMNDISFELPGAITEGLIWIAEQLPGRFKAVDMTNNMAVNGSSYVLNGIPYFEDILMASGVTRESLIENILDENMTKLETVDTYLRKHAFRGDLMGEQSMPYGNIDMKLFAYEPTAEFDDYHAFSGPLFITPKSEKYLSGEIPAEALTKADLQTEEVAELEIISDYRPTQSRSVRNDIQAIAMQRFHQRAPFKWSNGNFKNIRHNGHPDEWNFEKVSPTWAWTD